MVTLSVMLEIHLIVIAGYMRTSTRDWYGLFHIHVTEFHVERKRFFETQLESQLTLALS